MNVHGGEARIVRAVYGFTSDAADVFAALEALGAEPEHEDAEHVPARAAQDLQAVRGLALRVAAQQAADRAAKAAKRGRPVKPIPEGRVPCNSRNPLGMAYYNEDRRMAYAAKLYAEELREVRPYQDLSALTDAERLAHRRAQKAASKARSKAARASKAAVLAELDELELPTLA